MSTIADAAIEAFRNVERKSLARERAGRELYLATARLAVEGTDEDRVEYARATSEILDEFEAKRAKAGL